MIATPQIGRSVPGDLKMRSSEIALTSSLDTTQSIDFSRSARGGLVLPEHPAQSATTIISSLSFYAATHENGEFGAMFDSDGSPVVIDTPPSDIRTYIPFPAEVAGAAFLKIIIEGTPMTVEVCLKS